MFKKSFERFERMQTDDKATCDTLVRHRLHTQTAAIALDAISFRAMQSQSVMKETPNNDQNPQFRSFLNYNS
jgi:hypothetical protein